MDTMKDDLAELPIFSDVSRAEAGTIRGLLTQLPVRAGRVLVHEGARGDEFMIIAAGELVVSRGDRTIAVLGRGDVVGEMALLAEDGPGRRNATVTARTDAVVYVGTPVEFRQILHVAPSVARKVRATAATRALGRAA